MTEIYRFTARVASRWPSEMPKEIQIVPKDPQAFLAYRDRAGLTFDPYWHGAEIWVSVGSQELVARCENAERVEYAVERRGDRMFGVDLVPLS